MKTHEMGAAILKLLGGDRIVIGGGELSPDVEVYKGAKRLRRWLGYRGSRKECLADILARLEREQPRGRS